MARGKKIDILWGGLRNDSGAMLSAGTVTAYEPGTTTLKSVYSDQALTTALSNPFTLDAYGRKDCFGNGAYKFLVKDSAGTTLYTIDNLDYYPADGRILFCGDAGGAANAYTVTPPIASGAYGNGDIFIFKANHTCSGASTLSPSGLTAKAIRKGDGTLALSSGDIIDDNTYWVVYNSTDGVFVLLNPSSATSTLVHGGTSGGSANAQTLTPTPAASGYTAGNAYSFIAGYTNTGATTLNVSGLGAKNVRKGDGSQPLTEGDITEGYSYIIMYDGTQFILSAPLGPVVIDRENTTVSFSSTTAEQTLYSETIKGDTLETVRGLRVTAFGDVKNTTGSAVTFIIRVKYGTTPFWAMGTVNISATTVDRGLVMIEFWLFGADSKSAQRGFGRVSITNSINGTNIAGGSSTAYTSLIGGYVSGGENAGIDNTLSITGQLGTSGASIEMRMHNVVVEQL